MNFYPWLTDFDDYEELNTDYYYKYYLNRVVDDLSPINTIRMDSNFAYLLGNNVHFAYKHSIHHDFIQDRDSLVFEFVDRSMFDMVQMSDITTTSELGYTQYYFYLVKANGIDIISMTQQGPAFVC